MADEITKEKLEKCIDTYKKCKIKVPKIIMWKYRDLIAVKKRQSSKNERTDNMKSAEEMRKIAMEKNSIKTIEEKEQRNLDACLSICEKGIKQCAYRGMFNYDFECTCTKANATLLMLKLKTEGYKIKHYKFCEIEEDNQCVSSLEMQISW